MLGFQVAVESEKLLPFDDGESSVQRIGLSDLNITVVVISSWAVLE
jgi:hypothetical protein